MKYVICAYVRNVENFSIPRQLSVVKGEPLIGRTIRLLKENGAEDILITSADPRFEGFGARTYIPKHNDYDAVLNKGFWLSAFPIELMTEPIVFLLGDVYYSENAIKTIVNSQTDSVLFFCSYKNPDPRYIKHHDEPYGFKVVDTDLFKRHIENCKRIYKSGGCRRNPICWELYRSLNGIEITKHEMRGNYIAINDETCDVDRPIDIQLLNDM